MHVQVPAHDILVPELIVIPKLPLAWDRKCLQPLLNARDASPRAQLDWLHVQIVDRASLIHEAEEEAERQRQQSQKLAPNLLTARYEVGCFLNYLEDRALFRLLGCDSMRNYKLEQWPGQKISFKQLKKYLLVARFIPEAVVESGEAGITLLWRVAEVEHATVIELLCEYVLSGTAPRLVGSAAAKARELLDQKLPLEVTHDAP